MTQQEGVVSVGGIIGSGIGLATTRLAEEGKIPLFLVKSGNNEILTQSSRYTFRTCLPAAAMVAQSVVQLAQRREIRSVGVMIADYAWGQSFKSSLEDAAKSAPNIKFNIQVAPVPTTNFTPYLRAFGDVSLIVATGHPPGAPLVLAQAGQLGLKAPVVGADGPWSLTAKSTTTSAFGRYSDFKCMATASKEYKSAREALPADVPAERVHGGRRAGGLRVRQDRRGGDQQGRAQRQRIAAYVHAHTFNIPGYAWPLRWTAWGEMIGARPQYAILTKGAPPERGLNTASTTFWPRVIFKSPALTPYRPPS